MSTRVRHQQDPIRRSQPFHGFATFPTRHCVTGSLRHVYEYYGNPISEVLLLELGRGLGFVYFHIKGTDPSYGGRANNASPQEEGLQKTAGRRAGVRVEAAATSSARKAETVLREQDFWQHLTEMIAA